MTATRVLVLSSDRLLPEFLRRGAGGLRVDAFTDAAACAKGAIAIDASDHPVIVVARRVAGREASELLGELRAAVPTVPLVLASPDDADRTLARNERAAYLHVPFDAGELAQVLGVATRARKLVLVVDDSFLIHRHTVPILEEAGYEVVSSYDGDAALLVADERRPDLVITDVEMPGRNGYELCAALKVKDPHRPVVICSSLGDPHDLEKGFDAGADDYLVKPAAPDELLSRIKALLVTAEPGARERILVVDDSPAIRHLVADALVRQGFAVSTAEDGCAALDAIDAGPRRPDLVITDYDMPRMSGFELVHALRRDAALREIPVMMLTARDTRRDQAQMRSVGLTAYLVKPFSVDKCVAMVERILAERRLLAYKEASRLYISDGAARAAEAAADAHGEGRAEIETRAEEREVAVLFSDICGFTNMSSRMAPKDVVGLLNEFFDVMCPILRDEGGDIDKFIGDAIMAIFESPKESPRADAASGERDPAALRAVRAALHMQQALMFWNRDTGRDLWMRIGINCGAVVRGDIGSRHVRRDFTVIGDAVNRAQRFEANAPRGGVLIGARTYELVKDRVRVEEIEGLKLKGVDEPVRAYVVLGLVEEARIS